MYTCEHYVADGHVYDDAGPLSDPAEIIGSGAIRVRFTYPLDKPVIAEFTQAEWTVQKFIDAVCAHYQQIYREESATTKNPVARAWPLVNRNQTTGKYGIWGHDIEDLVLIGFSKGSDGVFDLVLES